MSGQVPFWVELASIELVVLTSAVTCLLNLRNLSDEQKRNYVRWLGQWLVFVVPLTIAFPEKYLAVKWMVCVELIKVAVITWGAWRGAVKIKSNSLPANERQFP